MSVLGTITSPIMVSAELEDAGDELRLLLVDGARLLALAGQEQAKLVLRQALAPLLRPDPERPEHHAGQARRQSQMTGESS